MDSRRARDGGSEVWSGDCRRPRASGDALDRISGRDTSGRADCGFEYLRIQGSPPLLRTAGRSDTATRRKTARRRARKGLAAIRESRSKKFDGGCGTTLLEALDGKVLRNNAQQHSTGAVDQ